jgi:hypothetical protein
VSEFPEFSYRGARALVMMHEDSLRHFVTAWRQAKSAGVRLPKVDRPDYASLEALLEHALRWSRTYITWTCEQLGIPDPGIRDAPAVENVEAELDAYLEHLLSGWRTALCEVEKDRFHEVTYPAPWGTPYCIDAMLEHAVMHPVRHRFQLEELMRNHAKRDRRS